MGASQRRQSTLTLFPSASCPPPASVPFLRLAVIPEVLQPSLHFVLVLMDLRGEEGSGDRTPFPAENLPDPGQQRLAYRGDVGSVGSVGRTLFRA